MITVIFGAGASYDSDRALPAGTDDAARLLAPLRPPLAANLFARNDVTGAALDSLPVLQSAATRLRGLEGVGVEDELGRLQDEAATDPVRARQLVAARLYLRSTLDQITRSWSKYCHGTTSYAWLHDVLHGIRMQTGSDICYLTFNYDRLLDEAIERLYGVRFGELDDYTDGVEGVQLHKLHGSLDWVWPRPDLGGWESIRPDGQAATLLLAAGPSVEADEQPDLVVSSAAHSTRQDIRTFTNGKKAENTWLIPHVPALAIPVRHKYSLVLPEAMVDRMRRQLEGTTRLIVVGWRAQEEHVLGILRDHLGRNEATLIVDRDAGAAREREKALRRARVRLGHVRLSEHGFAELRADEVTSFAATSHP